MTRQVLAATLCVALTACAANAPGGQPPTARALTAALRDAQGNPVGTATLVPEQGAVRVSVTASGLQPGEHGVHVHARGACTPPDFATAGGHFNPGARSHGWSNPNGPHAGDLPNMSVGADGAARYDARTPHLVLAGPGAVQADSAALVIHAGRDDQLTDPSGNSGARMVCGVLTAATGRRTR